MNLIPLPRRIILVITFGTPEGMFCIFVLGICVSRPRLALGKVVLGPQLAEI